MPYGYYYPIDVTAIKASDFSDMGKWKPYTPILTGFGTTTNVAFRSRRMMDSLSIIGTFKAGTPTGTEARISLGFDGFAENITSLLSLPTLSYCGDAKTDGIGDAGKQMLVEPGKAYLTMGNSGGIIVPLLKAVGNLLIGTNGTISLVASIPIEEWK